MNVAKIAIENLVDTNDPDWAVTCLRRAPRTSQRAAIPANFTRESWQNWVRTYEAESGSTPAPPRLITAPPSSTNRRLAVSQ